MSDALLLLPDFALIVIGWLVCRHTPLNRPVWDGAERLVYHVLFPALLFSSILRHPLALVTGGPGTGKTTTVAKLLAILVETGLQAGKAPAIRLVACPCWREPSGHWVLPHFRWATSTCCPPPSL